MNNTYFCFNIVFALHWVFRHGDAVSKTAAVIDPDQTADEWAKIKPLVVKVWEASQCVKARLLTSRL